MLLISIGMVKGGDARRTFVEQVAVLIFERFQSADAAADDDAEALAIYFFQIDAAVVLRHFRRGHREMREAIGAACVLRIFEEILRIEIAHLAARSCNRKPVVSKRVDHADAADAVLADYPRRSATSLPTA